MSDEPPRGDCAADHPGAAEPVTERPAAGATLLLSPLLLAVSAAVCTLGYVQKLACRRAGFDLYTTFENACYTDIYPLFYGRGLADGKVPYLDPIPEPVEYPVIIGAFMHAVGSLARWLTPAAGDPAGPFGAGLRFYDLTVIGLTACALLAVVATAWVAGRYGLRTGLMFALAPGLLLAAFINWDLLAIVLVAGALAAWSRRAPALAGVLLGLAVGAKFYPAVFLGAFFLLSVRSGQLKAFGRLLAGAAGSWAAAHAVVLLAAGTQWRTALEGLSRFYVFSRERPVDWGSIWYPMHIHQVPYLGDAELLNSIGMGSFLLLCAGIAVLAWCAPRRPRLPQLLLLVLVAFMITNKVWSPQFVLWLLPIVALARPKLPAYIAWQLGEIGYFLGIWFYLRALGVQEELGVRDLYPVPFLGTEVVVSATEIQNLYWAALLGRFLTVTLLAALVVREILRPERDLVRSGGDDDPAGGVFDGAADRFSLSTVLARRSRRSSTRAPAASRTTAASATASGTASATASTTASAGAPGTASATASGIAPTTISAITTP